jgi:hypothetical protein
MPEEHPKLNADMAQWSRWAEENYPFDTECRSPGVKVLSVQGLEKLRYVGDREQAAILARLYFVSERDGDKIAAEKKLEQAEKIAERRKARIALVQACLDRKHGDEMQGLAQRLVGFDPHQVKSLVLWDFERHFHWMRARAAGVMVPSKLRPVHEIVQNQRVIEQRDELFASIDNLGNQDDYDRELGYG